MRSVCLVLCLIFLFSVAAYAKNLELKPFLYTQDFEGQDPVSDAPWAVGAEYTLNFKGLTDERAHSGNQSYKIDITIKKGRYVYFSIPVSIPVEGNLKFSAWVFVPEENQGRANTGVNFAFPPTPNSGCTPLNGETFTSTNGEWKYVEADITKDGLRHVGLVTKYIWGVTSDELASSEDRPVGIYVDRIGFFMLGEDNKRVVMYLDDIKIEGEAPDQAEYNNLIQSSWASVKSRMDEKFSSWNNTISSLRNDITSMPENTEELAELKKEATANLTTLIERYEGAKKKPYLELADQSYIDTSITQLSGMRALANDIASGKIQLKDIRVTMVAPVSDLKILPTTGFFGGRITDTIDLKACAGQFVPASFVVKPIADLGSLLVKPGSLRNGNVVIPSANVDVKLVKCWYQAGSAWRDIGQSKHTRVLVPELLLNDDALVRVDYEKQDNYVRASFPDGEKYIHMSDPDRSGPSMGRHSVEDYPFEDADTLKPIALAKGINQQYWVTIKVPEDAKPGNYTGRITIVDDRRTLGVLKVNLTVLPFELDEPYYVSSIYYRGVLGKGWEKGSISSEVKSEQQLKNELRNLIEHGVDNPTVYQGFNDKDLLGRYLTLFREAGWNGKTLYYLGVGINQTTTKSQENIDNFRRICHELKEFCKDYGVEEIYVYGIDEATGELLESQRKAFEAAHEAGVKLFVAGYHGTFELVGDLLDILVFAGSPSKAQAELWHSKNHQIWSYANPQGGVENPLINRRNFGLVLWKYDFDGACTYAYQHAFGHIWDDFDDNTYRDHNMTYPTTTGVIDTIAWEGYREGVTDVRYLTTLLNTIKKAKADGKTAKAEAAEKYLDSIDVHSDDLDGIREEMIKHILQLKK